METIHKNGEKKEFLLKVKYTDGWKTFKVEGTFIEGKVFSGINDDELLTNDGGWDIPGINNEGWIYADTDLSILEKNTSGHMKLGVRFADKDENID